MKNQCEWENISKNFFSTFRGETFTTFSQRAKSVTYAEIKDRISDFSSSNTVKLITEYSESGVDQVTNDSVINKWDEWNEITKVKRKTLEKNKNDFEAELGAKWIELNEIDSKITEAQIRKTVAEKTIETAKKGKMKGLKDAFNAINAKTNKTYYYAWYWLGTSNVFKFIFEKRANVLVKILLSFIQRRRS